MYPIRASVWDDPSFAAMTATCRRLHECQAALSTSSDG